MKVVWLITEHQSQFTLFWIPTLYNASSLTETQIECEKEGNTKGEHSAGGGSQGGRRGSASPGGSTEATHLSQY